MGLRLISKPAAEPITLLEAAQQVKLADTQEEAEALPDKALLQALIRAATLIVENYTGRQLVPATFELVLEKLPHRVELPRPPFLHLVSLSYATATQAGVELASESYAVLEGSEPAVLVVEVPADAVEKPNAVRIQFKAGYEETTEDGPLVVVPEDLKWAIKLILADLYDNREDTVVGTIATKLPRGSEAIMQPYRINNI